MQIQRNTIMAKQQTRKSARDANKRGASEANRPTRKDEHQPRRRNPRPRSGPTAAATASEATAELPEVTAENSPLSITNNEALEQSTQQPRSGSQDADGARVSVTTPDLPRASTKRAMLIGMLERAQGASVAEIGQRLGWLPHTVRAAITGLRHAGREVTHRKNENGQTVYRLAPVETQDR
jgi:biotin operon repressor